MATSPLPARGPQNAENGYNNPCLSKGPQCSARGETQKWLIHPYLLEIWAKWLITLPSRGSPSLITRRNLGVATSPLPTQWPKIGQNGNITSALLGASSAQHREKLRKWLLQPYQIGVYIWAEWLHNPCLLGGPL